MSRGCGANPCTLQLRRQNYIPSLALLVSPISLGMAFFPRIPSPLATSSSLSALFSFLISLLLTISLLNCTSCVLFSGTLPPPSVPTPLILLFRTLVPASALIIRRFSSPVSTCLTREAVISCYRLAQLKRNDIILLLYRRRDSCRSCIC